MVPGRDAFGTGRSCEQTPSLPSCVRLPSLTDDAGRRERETRLANSWEWSEHPKTGANVRGEPPPGDQPKNWRATGPRNGGRQPKNWIGKPLLFLLCRHLRVHPRLQSVTCPRSRAAVVRWFSAWGYRWAGFDHVLYLSTLPLPSSSDSPLPAAVSEGGPSATSLCSLTQRREIYTLPRTLYFIPAVDPSSRAVRRTTTRCLWSQS